MRQTDEITSDDQNGWVKAQYLKQKKFVIALIFHYIRVPFSGRQRVFSRIGKSPFKMKSI
jgi:hypothetical protein